MAKHSMGGLSYEERSTGVIFGFLRQILKLSIMYDTNQFIFFWDSKESLRKKIYPEYKANRKKEKTKEEQAEDVVIHSQFTDLRCNILSSIGFQNIFHFSGYESDDLIAYAVFQTLKHLDFDGYVIVSADEDMYQLLSDNVCMYNPQKKKEYTDVDFIREHQIDPIDWFEVKAIAGCTSDNVKGINGVGPATAIKYLNGNLKTESKLYQQIVSSHGQKIIKRNIRLVRLPLTGTPNFFLVNNEKLMINNFMRICQRYGFTSMLQPKELRKWEEALKLQ